MTDIYHVLPLDDLKPHVVGDRCKCEPSSQYKGAVRIVIHNAWDGREFYEQDAQPRGH